MRVGSVTFKPKFGEITLDKKINIKQNAIASANINSAMDDEISLVIKNEPAKSENFTPVTKPVNSKSLLPKPFLTVTARK